MTTRAQQKVIEKLLGLFRSYFHNLTDLLMYKWAYRALVERPLPKACNQH